MGAPQKLRAEVAAYKRRRILEEASHLFFQHGYGSTTLDMVAERLHVTKPFIYSYYRNKSELLFEICQSGIQLSLAALDEALGATVGPLERLKRMVDMVARLVIENQEYIVVYQREEKNLQPADARAIRVMRKEFDRRVAALLREGAEAGVFEIEDASLTAASIDGMITWLSVWYVPSGRLSVSEIVSHTIKLVLKMVAPSARN
ncbi:MAG: TetR/AcrR family transcriptional regulator [Alphaproteobacteria bacterium]|nr:MAG: TetR/AcrR family transcriptional regulator [Alphaproteobacteria bacterium]